MLGSITPSQATAPARRATYQWADEMPVCKGRDSLISRGFHDRIAPLRDLHAWAFHGFAAGWEISVDGLAQHGHDGGLQLVALPSVDANAHGQRLPADPAWSAVYEMDPVLVFRYSALTWNGHRIHYDADYARREEGYPGCVMNGALTLHLVIEEALARAGGRRLAGLSAKLVKPLFVGGKLTVAGAAIEGASVAAWAGDEQGHLAATCTLEFEEQ